MRKEHPEGLDTGDVLVHALLARAAAGDIDAIKLAFDRHEGKAITPIQVTKTETKTFTVNLRKTDSDGTEKQLTFGTSALPGPSPTVIDVTPESDPSP